jgi:hypothetical protein
MGNRKHAYTAMEAGKNSFARTAIIRLSAQNADGDARVASRPAIVISRFGFPHFS